jgi:hypothetical protein
MKHPHFPVERVALHEGGDPQAPAERRISVYVGSRTRMTDTFIS